MNPFTGTLNRLGFLFWSIPILLLAMVDFVISFSDTSLSSSANLLFWITAALVLLFMALIFGRRLQNAGYNAWLAILFLFIPFNWLILLILPTRIQKH